MFFCQISTEAKSEVPSASPRGKGYVNRCSVVASSSHLVRCRAQPPLSSLYLITRCPWVNSRFCTHLQLILQAGWMTLDVVTFAIKMPILFHQQLTLYPGWPYIRWTYKRDAMYYHLLASYWSKLQCNVAYPTTCPKLRLTGSMKEIADLAVDAAASEGKHYANRRRSMSRRRVPRSRSTWDKPRRCTTARNLGWMALW